ncbi:MAG: triose-phosphate isomerase [Candidatus Nealsonbacteria bacterium]|nr:triose-phosphate isomerase [Candidatus Nealsonbacteria bacterium]
MGTKAKRLVVANWKMNPKSDKEALALFKELAEGLKDLKEVDVVVCPSFLHIPAIVYSGKGRNLQLGAQNMFWEEKGAFTGEVSPAQLSGFGVKYVILGHSERRKIGETDEIIAKKVRAALDVGFTPILCIGETLDDRNSGEWSNRLNFQLRCGLENVRREEMGNVAILYEPFWAVGTSRACGAKEARETRLFAEDSIGGFYNDPNISKDINSLYGGSVTSKNAGSYVKEAGYNGLLVGGASLDPKEFIKIIKAVA